ncbi:hypothetical protein ACRWQL_19570 [Shewanella sp. HL-SH4]|uniref:hypothetical protein n=1 Tax=Shewanella sp. HL-SH4 TaxID=3436240 RepID=UPI003EB843DD
MTKNLLKIALSLPLLTSCVSTIDQTIPLSNEFQTSSTVIILDNPSFRIPDSVYNNDLGIYSVVNAETSWKSSQKNLVDRKKDISFINYILFDDALSFISAEYEVDDTQRFSFTLQQNDENVSTSKCEIFSQSLTKETEANDIEFSGPSSHSSHNTRLKTYLVCAITHNQKLWQLTLKSYQNQTTIVQVKSDDRSYQVEDISQNVSLVKKGDIIEQRHSAPWRSLSSGLEFFDNKEQVGALSFVGKPKIWLKNDLPDQTKQLLVSINYSLTMFNWLDSDWR